MSSTETTVHVVLPAALADLFPGAPRRFDMEAASVRDLVDGLERRWPGMGGFIRDSRPAIRKHMAIFVDGERATLKTPLSPRSDVFIITAISGG
ncbi:MoaD/ThiS family protein [Rhizobium sp. NRK18]|uniref:MoaD/ThiS family protein n=1 Tax=Rhizobium sp. NRK18 TaxID=2964667 RepID=UPI0021C4B64B|nr:MoaD/ThiS family protein [Rhizobium sp. NRK18]MCQ2004808.1 MoaD/ThiS family protein [Rhizobium sp. NRK18]